MFFCLFFCVNCEILCISGPKMSDSLTFMNRHDKFSTYIFVFYNINADML